MLETQSSFTNNGDNNKSKNEGIIICCTRKNCNYMWRYRGYGMFFATCPRCRRNIKIPKNKVEETKSPLQPNNGYQPVQAEAVMTRVSGVIPSTL